MGEKWRGKSVGRDKYLLISEGKRGETTASDAKTFALHLPQAGWCPESLQAGVALEGQPPVLLLCAVSYSMEYPCGQLGPAVLAVFLPCLWHTPSLLTGEEAQ